MEKDSYIACIFQNMKERYRVRAPCNNTRKILAFCIVWEGKMTDSRQKISLAEDDLSWVVRSCIVTAGEDNNSPWMQSCWCSENCSWCSMLSYLSRMTMVYAPRGNPPLLRTCLQSRPQIIVFVLNVVSASSELVFKRTSTEPSEEIELILKNDI